MPDPAAGIAVSLESVLRTGDLYSRPPRPPDYETENRALLELAQHMADSPRTSLQKLAEVAMKICRAGSAGVSVVSRKTGDFYWPAIAGVWNPQVGGGIPRNFGPCSVVLDRNAVLLFSHPERFYPYRLAVSPPIVEALVAPFSVLGDAVGTLWVVAHDATCKFDAEDARLIESLGRFAEAVYSLRAALEADEHESDSMLGINERLIVSLVRQHELTEQAEAAEAGMRKSEERLRFMAESMPQKIFTAKADGSVDYLNGQWMEFTGLVFDRIKDWGWKQFIHPDDLEDNVRLWNESIGTGQPFHFQHRFRRLDGVYRWHLSRAHAMLDTEGVITMWIGSSTEIHDEKEIEKELRRANEDLNQFAFAASHDLQEPLRMITSYSQLLLRGYRGQLDANAEICVKFVTEGAKRMRELLADLLSFAEMGAASPDVLEPVDLNAILEKAAQNLKTAIEESGAVLSVDRLPAIRGQEAHFLQLFQNLIGNGIKYRGALPPRILVSVERRNTEWLFTVADNGMGIEAKYHGQIFGVFKRLHGKEIPGTGIGLAICHRVVERYGGRIWVESEEGQGARFYFTLPVVDGGSE